MGTGLLFLTQENKEPENKENKEPEPSSCEERPGSHSGLGFPQERSLQVSQL